MTVKLTRIARNKKTSKKTGRDYISVGIQTDEHGDKWLNSLDANSTRDWKAGDTVDINVKETPYGLDFEPIEKQSHAPTPVEARLDKLEYLVQGLIKKVGAIQPEENTEINAEDLPF